MTDENRGASAASGRNAKRVRLIRVCAVVFFAFAGKAVSRRHPVLRTRAGALCNFRFVLLQGSMDVFRSKMVRDVRFSKFSLSFTNKSMGTVLDYGIRSLRNKHMLFLHFDLYERIAQFQVSAIRITMGFTFATDFSLCLLTGT